MVYNFSDIYNEELYANSMVLVMLGQYPIFSDIIVDHFKELNKTEISSQSSELLTEFGYSTEENFTLSTIDFDNLDEIKNTIPVSGKWFCSVQYNSLVKKQKDWLEEYIKNPSENAVLVVNVTDYRDFGKFYKNRALKASSVSHLIKLSFPDRVTLKKVIQSKMPTVLMDSKAIDLFIMRLGRDYNEYSGLLDSLNTKYRYGELSYKGMLIELKGIENFAINDFIVRLNKPMEENIQKRKKIYSIEKSLLNEYGYQGLIRRLKSKLRDLIDMRLLINTGIVPIYVKYNVKRVQAKLDNNHNLKKFSEYAFRMTSRMATDFCLRDLVIMQSMLDKIDRQSTEAECAKALHALIHRTAFDKNRILNDIGIKNLLESDVKQLDSIVVHKEKEPEVKRIFMDSIYHIG